MIFSDIHKDVTDSQKTWNISFITKTLTAEISVNEVV